MRTITKVGLGACALALLASAAWAQSDEALTPGQIEVIDIIAASALDAEFPPQMAIGMGQCFGALMTEDEVEAFLAADSPEAQQEVTSGMAAYDTAIACTVDSLQ